MKQQRFTGRVECCKYSRQPENFLTIFVKKNRIFLILPEHFTKCNRKWFNIVGYKLYLSKQNGPCVIVYRKALAICIGPWVECCFGILVEYISFIHQLLEVATVTWSYYNGLLNTPSRTTLHGVIYVTILVDWNHITQESDFLE